MTNWKQETEKIIQRLIDTGALLAYIDLFCGAGGTTTGVEKAKRPDTGGQLACVILGINHDLKAIASHRLAHPHTLHLVEDVRKVALEPICEMIQQIRARLPYLKIVLGASLECTHHSRAKGGDTRDEDSRSLAQELFRYKKFIEPDMVQIENVTEFRSWGPLIHKRISTARIKPGEYKFSDTSADGKTVYSHNGKTWLDAKGYGYRKDRKKGITAWMIPDPEQIGAYFRKWVKWFCNGTYQYEDRNLNAAEYGGVTTRTRYFGQFVKHGLPLCFPKPTHSKNGANGLKPFRAVKEVLDMGDKGPSLFIPDRIKSDKTHERVYEGCLKFVVPGGKKAYEDFLVVYNSASGNDGNVRSAVRSIDRPSPVIPTRNAVYKANVEFISKYFSGNAAYMNTGIDSPAGTVRTKDGQALICSEFLPFILQWNNNCDANSISEPSKPLTTKDKFGMVQPAFIHQRNTGKPASKIADIKNPSRTLTKTGGNLELVQVEEVLPFLFKYHGNGNNLHEITKPSPTVDTKDRMSLITPFIMRDFTNGGQTADIGKPAGSIMPSPKMNLVNPESWLMDTSFNNIGTGTDKPAHTLKASRRHAYLVNPQFNNKGNSTEKPAPTLIARQDKKPLHLVQVEYGNKTVYGIAIYKTDTPYLRKLKKLMAVMGIVDIKMRMLKIPELLQIQGFDKNRTLAGNETDQKKQIGNSVETNTACALTESYGQHLVEMYKQYLKAA